jgi:hypothetical protein
MVVMGSLKNPDENGGALVAHRKRCVLCGKIINTFCLGCKRFLCVDKDRSKDLKEKYETTGLDEIDDYSTNVFSFNQTKLNQKTGAKVTEHFYGMRSCYHIAHEQVIDRELSAKSQQPSHFHRVTGQQTEATLTASQSISCAHLVQNFYNVAAPSSNN